MTEKEIYKLWAPAGMLWVDWVRPVAFIDLQTVSTFPVDFARSPFPYFESISKNTALFIDTPGIQSVQEGIALTEKGFRPIPLFNGTQGQANAMALVETHPLKSALQWGAAQLATISLPQNAPPAFLLDSNRIHRYKMSASVFDNSWDLYHQDIPTAEYFLQHEIHTLLIHSERVHKDLIKILSPFQKKGISIFFTTGYQPPKKIVLKKPLR